MTTLLCTCTKLVNNNNIQKKKKKKERKKGMVFRLIQVHNIKQ